LYDKILNEKNINEVMSMQCVKEYRIKEKIKVKYFSDIEMFKKMFFLNLHYRYERAEMQRKNGTLISFEDVIADLNRKYGFVRE